MRPLSGRSIHPSVGSAFAFWPAKSDVRVKSCLVFVAFFVNLHGMDNIHQKIADAINSARLTLSNSITLSKYTGRCLGDAINSNQSTFSKTLSKTMESRIQLSVSF